MRQTIGIWTARSATFAGAVAMCGFFQAAHGQPALASSTLMTCTTRGPFQAQVLQPQSTDIGSRSGELATTRHRWLAGFLIPEEKTSLACGDFSSPRAASAMRRSHRVHGDDPPSDPPAKAAESFESFHNLE